MKQPCSCVVCRKEFSHKGIYSHYITLHTKEGNDRVRKNALLGAEKGVEKTKLKTLQTKQTYDLNPNYCFVCSQPLSYEQKHYKYCSRSCAATHTNKTRNPFKHTKKHSYPQRTKIKFCVCKICNSNFIWNSEISNLETRNSKTFCSEKCYKTQFSLLAKNRNFGGVRQSRKINYNGVNLGSSYEVSLAKIFYGLNISWIKPNRLPYKTPTGKESTYEADLYLPEYNLYLDPKNDFLINSINPSLGYKDIDKIAWVAEQNQITVAVIDKNNLNLNFVNKLLMVGQEGFEPSVILSCKDSGFDHSHHCPIIYI